MSPNSSLRAFLHGPLGTLRLEAIKRLLYMLIMPFQVPPEWQVLHTGSEGIAIRTSPTTARGIQNRVHRSSTKNVQVHCDRPWLHRPLAPVGAGWAWEEGFPGYP